MSSSMEKDTAKFILGFDLGTTNSVLAYAPLDAENPQVELLALPQLVSSGTVESRTMLPSFAYLANTNEAGGGVLDLPWAKQRDFAVGEYARRQGAEVPDRTVGAAKSWLAYSRVDRHQPILPWGAPESVAKISPVTASQRYLEHMVAAWQELHPRSPRGRATRGLDRAGLLRCQRPRVDPRGGAGRRAAPRSCLAGRAAGGRLCLAGRPRRPLAEGVETGRYVAGLRRGRWHDRPLAGYRGRRRRRTGPPPHGRGKSPPRRWRQHGPGPGPPGCRPFCRNGNQARPLAVCRLVALLPQRQGIAPGRRRRSRAKSIRFPCSDGAAA